MTTFTAYVRPSLLLVARTTLPNAPRPKNANESASKSASSLDVRFPVRLFPLVARSAAHAGEEARADAAAEPSSVRHSKRLNSTLLMLLQVLLFSDKRSHATISAAAPADGA
jgi:hypothetical protein